jgi:hypothetical protein
VGGCGHGRISQRAIHQSCGYLDCRTCWPRLELFLPGGATKPNYWTGSRIGKVDTEPRFLWAFLCAQMPTRVVAQMCQATHSTSHSSPISTLLAGSARQLRRPFVNGSVPAPRRMPLPAQCATRFRRSAPPATRRVMQAFSWASATSESARPNTSPRNASGSSRAGELGAARQTLELDLTTDKRGYVRLDRSAQPRNHWVI